MSSDASCEELSVRKGAGYDETFGSSDEFENFSHLSERETSAQSPDDDVESYAEGCKEVEREDKVGKKGSGSDGDDDGDEKDDDGDEESCEGTLVGPGDNRPFILPEEWAVNRFLPLMSCVLSIRSQNISHFVSLGRMRDATRGGPPTSACTTPCFLWGLDCL